VIGIDPNTLQLAQDESGRHFTEEEALDLTLLKIVKDDELIGKLNVFDLYMKPQTEHLSDHQRRYPEQEVASWTQDDKELYYRAARIVIERIKKLNPGLDGPEDLEPGTRILLPDPAIF
jgi:hypothetical protein